MNRLVLLVGMVLMAPPTGRAAAQESLSFDLLGGSAARLGGLAEITTDRAPVHAGIGIATALGEDWGLRLEAVLHQFEERQFDPVPLSDGQAVTDHLRLSHFLLVGERQLLGGPSGIQLRLRAGLGATHTGSDQGVRASARQEGHFSHFLPLLHGGTDLGYASGIGEVFLRVGGNLSPLTASQARFYRIRSNGEIEDFGALISIPVSLGLRLRF